MVLRSGREAAPLAGHPWVFSGSIAGVLGDPRDGAEVDVHAADGRFVGRGLFNGRSQIRVRLYRDAPGPLDADLWAERIDAALALRRALPGRADPRGAARIVFSEGDGLSGLTVDRYGSWLSVQLTSLALAERRDTLLELLEERLSPEGVVLRTEKGILEEEGLELRDGVLRGSVPEEPVVVREGTLDFAVDLRTGQKTGFYLDQRENRTAVARWAEGRAVADVCCYTGGFSLAAAAAGATRVVGVDASERALELAASNAARNGLAERTSFERGDAFRWLEAQAAAGRRFGMLVLDPPRFARSRRGVPQALKAYERLNGLALACLEPDGILVTCSCSGRVGADDFLAAVARGGARAGRRVQLLERRGQAPDHPVAAACPEGDYLKCLVCRVV